MQYPYYTGTRTEPVTDNLIPVLERAHQTLPEYYDTEPALADAVNVALLVNQPLLLTGEPGCGKTQLAFRIAWELGYKEPIKFETKSTSKAQDLFYYYNSLGRFHDAQSKISRDDAFYITFNALGLAILRTTSKDRYAHLKKYMQEENSFPYCSCRSVVLIDEIDKAARDFPNDILNEIENMYFRIPELGNIQVSADPAMAPILIITSNSEKDLPDTFMRRCVFYHIEFPKPERMLEIVKKRLESIPDKFNSEGIGYFLYEAVDFFYELRKPNHGIKKPPSTAELLAWLLALNNMSSKANPLIEDHKSVMKTIGALVKNKDDLESVKGVISSWQSKPGK